LKLIKKKKLDKEYKSNLESPCPEKKNINQMKSRMSLKVILFLSSDATHALSTSYVVKVKGESSDIDFVLHDMQIS
jgi:hypothetical protein